MFALDPRLEACSAPDDADVVKGPAAFAGAAYEETLAAEDFDTVPALRQLDMDDLIAAGISKGHSKMLLTSVRASAAASVPAPPPFPTHAPAPVAVPAPKLVKAAPFCALGADGLPSGRDFRAWLIGYDSACRIDSVNQTRLAQLAAVITARGVVPSSYPDGDPEDITMYDLLMTAGSEGLPVDLKLAIPAVHVTAKHGMQCIGWLLLQVLISSDASTAVLTDWFANPIPVTKPNMLGPALIHHDRAVEIITAVDRDLSDVAYRNSLNKLCSKLPEAVRKLEALEAVRNPIPRAMLRATYGKLGAKYSSLHTQK